MEERGKNKTNRKKKEIGKTKQIEEKRKINQKPSLARTRVFGVAFVLAVCAGVASFQRI